MHGRSLLLAASLLALPVHAQEKALRFGAPWQAQIYSPAPPEAYTEQERAAHEYWELSHRCGGSLIAEGWVLTAAHCLSPTMIERGWRIRLGARDLELDDGVTYRIDRTIAHARYSKDGHLNDIALVHFVADDATDSSGALRIAPIALNTDPIGEDADVSATGWGRTAERSTEKAAVELLQADMQVIDCNSVEAYEGKTTEDMVCAGAPGKDACQGDSGGPLVLTYGPPRLVGIVSWGEGCGRDYAPGVYVRIDADHYTGWIRRAMAAAPGVSRLD